MATPVVPWSELEAAFAQRNELPGARRFLLPPLGSLHTTPNQPSHPSLDCSMHDSGVTLSAFAFSSAALSWSGSRHPCSCYLNHSSVTRVLYSLLDRLPSWAVEPHICVSLLSFVARPLSCSLLPGRRAMEMSHEHPLLCGNECSLCARNRTHLTRIMAREFWERCHDNLQRRRSSHDRNYFGAFSACQ